METKQNLNVGEAVFYAREAAVGLIYETYTFVDGPGARPGVSLLLSDGRNIGGFNAQEADQFLHPLGDTGLDYAFTNVGQLAKDYAQGVFSQAMHEAQVLFISQTLAGKLPGSTPAPPMKIELACRFAAPTNPNPEYRTYTLNGKKLSLKPSQELSLFSQAFNHGYDGSGPRQLALAVCLELFGPTAALLVFRRFSEQQIAGIPFNQEFTAQLDMSEYAAQAQG